MKQNVIKSSVNSNLFDCKPAGRPSAESFAFPSPLSRVFYFLFTFGANVRRRRRHLVHHALFEW